MKIRLDDGAELYYTVDDFTDPWKETDTVVMHAGVAKNHRFWYAWMPILAARYRVVRFDARGMGLSTVPEPGYPWSLDNYANDLLQLVNGLELEKFHLIGETTGGAITMRFASLHQERLRSLMVCNSPTNFLDPHHLQTAELIERDGLAAWVEEAMPRRLDARIVHPAFIRWYSAQMSATAPHVVAGWNRATPGVDLRPELKNVQTPTLVLGHGQQGEEQGAEPHFYEGFSEAAKLFPNGRLLTFPGVIGYVQHVLPVPCAIAWLDFVDGLKAPGVSPKEA